MIKLDYFKKADFQQLIEWIDSADFLLQWGGPDFDYPLDDSQLERYIENANNDNPDAFVYKALFKETKETVGHISLGNIDRKNESARIGKVLVGTQNIRGQGIGQQMLHKVFQIAFEELKLHRVSLGVFDFNIPAISCYEKAGLKKEGLLRDSSKNGDEYWSRWEMSILENEWRDKKINS